jgi:hypothetical protein
MELKSTRRIVTGHDASGKAVALFDTAVPAKQRSPGSNGMTLLWVTSEFPVDMTSPADRAQTQVACRRRQAARFFASSTSRR